QLVNGIHYLKNHQLDNWFVYQLDEKHIFTFTHLLSLIDLNVYISTDELLEWKNKLPIVERKDLSISGEDITDIFPSIKKGAWIGKMIQQIEYHVVMGDLKNTKSEMKEWIQCHPPVKN